MFPEFFTSPLDSSIIGRALREQKVAVNLINLRDFGLGAYKQVDHRPYGGGAGMVLMIEPIANALKSIGAKKGNPNEEIILTSARGKPWQQQTAVNTSRLNRMIIICGHYEGVDQRIADHLVDSEISIGDYVLTGGEPAALCIIDSVVRNVPGVLGNSSSLEGESHSVPGQIGPAQYTRPASFNEWNVPETLLSGDHSAIANFRSQINQSN